MLACSLTEGLGLLLLVPLLGAVGLDVEQGSVGRLAIAVRGVFAALRLHPTLVGVLCVFVGVNVVQALLVRWQTIANERVCQHVARRCRSRLYQALARASWLFLSRARSSTFTHALTGEIDRLATATYCLLSLAATIAVTLVYVALALRLSAFVTILVFASGGALLFALSRRHSAARAAGERASATTRTVYGLAIEHLASMKTAKSYAAEERSSELFSRGVREAADAYLSSTRLQADSRAWFDAGSVVILAGLVLVTIEGQRMPAAGVFLLLFLFARIMPRVATIQQTVQQYINLLPSVAAVTALRSEAEANAESNDQPGRTTCPPLSRGVRLHDVTFRYDSNGDASAVDHLAIDIRAGDTIAVVGPSGSGKSTVADLVIGLLSPTAGQVLIDGAALRPEMLGSWRRQIGYVPQDTWLFHDTVRANLAWARPDATEAVMGAALRLAAADEIVASLPDGLDTVLGDRGARLSGGERQRIALARALLRRPSLLILDEATSAVDAENEQRILEAIARLHGSLTILMITHRLTSVRGADTIYVIEQGHLTESGSWDTLTATPGSRFRALCKAQGLMGEGTAAAGVA